LPRSIRYFTDEDFFEKVPGINEAAAAATQAVGDGEEIRGEYRQLEKKTQVAVRMSRAGIQSNALRTDTQNITRRVLRKVDR